MGQVEVCLGASGLDAERSQQKGRQMSSAALVGMGRSGYRFGRALWPDLVEASHRRRGVVTPRGALAPAVSVVAVFAFAVFALAVLTRFRALVAGCLRLFAHPGNGLADQLLD